MVEAFLETIARFDGRPVGIVANQPKVKGGVLPPEIRWQELTKPYGHAHATGRRHGPFSVASFLRAVNEELKKSGQRR